MLKIVYMNPEQLNPNDYNPNSHSSRSFDLLLYSIKEFGFTQPIIVNKPDMTIVDGENRWRCSMILNMPMVPVCFVNLTPEQMKIATILHNRARGKEIESLVQNIEIDIASAGVDVEKVFQKKKSDKS